MTENEAIKILTLSEEEQKEFPNLKEIYAIAVKALEEVQQYRAIGTVEELKTATKYIRLVAKHGTTGEVIETCAEYESIGTVEQCRGAVLLQKQKKIRPGYRGVDEPLCPYCDKVLKHEDTCECGQRIDWSDTSETENT